MRLPRWLGNPLAILAVVVGLGLLFARPQGATLAKGTRIARRSLETSEGRLALYGSGLTVLNFWGESCPPCRHEAPELARLHRGLADGGRGRVLGVSVDSRDLPAAKEAARTLGMRYPVAVLDRSLQSAFGVEVLPTTYLIDADGVVRWSHVGELTQRDVEAAIRAID